MKTLARGMEPGTGAQSEALIKEARRRQRRRYLLTGLVAAVLAGTAGVIVIMAGSAGSLPARQVPHHPRVPAGSGALASGRSGMPRFFADTVITAEGPGPLEVRSSASGGLVAQLTRLPGGVIGLAATGPGNFVVAVPVRGECRTRLYQVVLTSGGRPGRLTPVGPDLPGQARSLVAGAGGQLLGYAVSGCGKGSPASIGVLNTHTGQSRQWAALATEGTSSGGVVLGGALSMSANGRLLAFTGWDAANAGHAAGTATPAGQVQVVRILPTNAPAGTLAQRSRVVLSRPVRAPQLAGVTLSPDGSSFYLCTPINGKGPRGAEIVRYLTSSGRRQQLVATLGDPGFLAATDCNMTLDTTGRFLLVPYALSSPTHPLLKLASIDVASRAVAIITRHLPIGAGMDPSTGMTATW